MGSELLELGLRAAREFDRDDLPKLMAMLEEVRATALLRLSNAPAAPASDVMLDIETAAKRLGVSSHYLYRHAKKLPFSRRIGRKLLFSSQGIDRYIARSK